MLIVSTCMFSVCVFACAFVYVFGPSVLCYVLSVLWALLPEIKSSFILSHLLRSTWVFRRSTRSTSSTWTIGRGNLQWSSYLMWHLRNFFNTLGTIIQSYRLSSSHVPLTKMLRAEMNRTSEEWTELAASLVYNAYMTQYAQINCYCSHICYAKVARNERILTDLK